MTSASELLTMIKMDLGIYSLRLPFEDPDKALLEVIQLKSLKTFSIYAPDIIKVKVDLRKLKKIKDSYEESCYIIPHVYKDREIIYVKNVSPRIHNIGPHFSPMFQNTYESYQSLMLNSAYADLTSTAEPPFTFHFEPPNKLYLYNLVTSNSEVEIEYALSHASNFSTITSTKWQSFYDLALLDVKKFLYNTMKHYSELQSAFGTINLKIDDWSNAESERNDLINTWKDAYHLDGEPFYRI